MAVQCAQCGEELLGAVNCCWRCGHAFEVHSGPSDLPPVRRSPPITPFATVIAAGPAENAVAPESGEESAGVPTIRRGSPFADRGSAETTVSTADPAVLAALAPARPPNFRSGGSTAASSLTFPIGGIALVLAFTFPAGGMFVAAFGVAIGTWGLYSRRRGVALAGLMLCCVSLAVAGFNTAVQLYVHFYGIAPWENNDPSLPLGS